MSSQSGCENESNSTTNCKDSDLNNKSGKEACEEVKNQYDVMYKEIDALGDWSPAGLLKSLGSSNTVNSKVKNIIDNIQNSINSSDLNTTCGQFSSSNQTNYIGNTPECVAHQEAIIALLKDNPKALKEYLDSLTITDVKQDNTIDIKQQCITNAYMEAANKQDVSVENSALAQILEKSKGLLSDNETNTDQCQYIKNETNACNYLKIRSCCDSKNISDQQNILKCSGANKVEQKNSRNSYQYCNLTGTTDLTSDQASHLTNTSTVKSEQFSEGVDPMAFLLFLLLPFIICGGGTVLVGKFAKDLIPFMGLIPIIIGTIFIIIYVIQGSSKINRTVENKPLSGSKCLFNYYKGDH